jgi:hypothetical protein
MELHVADLASRIREIGRADLVVGIPSFNNAGTIGYVVKTVEAGLERYFPGVKAVLVNADGGSTDGTPEAVQSAAADPGSVLIAAPPIRIVTAYPGIPGKGSAFRAIFDAARSLEAKACAVVDSDLRSITPEWMDLMIGPILREGYDFTAPYYLRHKYDGTITNTMVYPLTRMLYGRRIRQPIGGDFGFSGTLAAHYAGQPVWDSDVARYGVDIWMSTTALAGGFKVCQAFLGAKIHDAKDPAADLSAMLHQVMKVLFTLMEQHAEAWRGVEGSVPVPMFGLTRAVDLEPVKVNRERLEERFRLGLRELAPVYQRVLAPDLWSFYGRWIGPSSPGPVDVPDEVWVRTLFDFALAFKRRTLNQDHLVQSLTPLYLGKVAAWVAETLDWNSAQVENRLDELCMAFEREKPRLAGAWASVGSSRL